jgi:hypothetical protein
VELNQALWSYKDGAPGRGFGRMVRCACYKDVALYGAGETTIEY